MKNTLKAFMVAAVAILMLTHNTKAQSKIYNTSNETSALTSFKYNGDVSSAISMRALKNFQKTFKNATNVNWYPTLGKGYIASFTADSIKTVVAYNRKGTWSYTIRYYNEKKLPYDVRYMVKSNYFDYEIMGTTEVNFNNQTVYMIYLQGEIYSKTIKICDGEMEEVKIYTRA